MKRFVQITVAAVLLGSLTIQADPIKTWSWTAPTEYENNTPIPTSDILSYTLYCGVTEGGPHDQFITAMNTPPPQDMDMAPLVGNQPGTYYCVLTATSSLYLEESAPSNEVNFTVLPGDLGLRPKPPVLSLGGV